MLPITGGLGLGPSPEPDGPATCSASKQPLTLIRANEHREDGVYKHSQVSAYAELGVENILPPEASLADAS